MKSLFPGIFLCCLLADTGFSQQKGYYRTPALCKNYVVFTAEGDLWKCDLTGGGAARLTSHPGPESNPVISPDGEQVVFTGEYEGINELYLMNIRGGVPKRLTYDFARSTRPVSWTRDGKILYVTTKYSGLPEPQLIKLDPVTMQIERVPLSQGSDGVYDERSELSSPGCQTRGARPKDIWAA